MPETGAGSAAATPERVGPYRLERRLGAGGMGVVYVAWDERLGRRVALKQVRPEVAGDPRRRERFRREARTVAQLDHPAIVQIHDLLETPEGDWIVLQYVEGPTLAARLRRGPLAPEEVAALGRDVAGALAQAHGRGLLHRDLKAENVVLAAEGARVLDFGLAKAWEPGSSGGSALTDGIVGTYRAMSPEQANGLELDPRSDLFSLGVLLYEAATGDSPFDAATPVETMSRVCTFQPRPASEVEPAMPVALSELIDALLEKEPARRPASAREVLRRLGGSGSAAVPAASSDLDAATVGSDGRAPLAPAAPRSEDLSSGGYRRIGRLPLLAAAAALAVAAAAGLFRARNGGPGGEPLYVVVARPELGSATTDDGAVRLAGAALHAALLRSLAALDGVVAVAAAPPEPGEEAPETRRLARIHAAGEVLASGLECADRRCLATLRRLRGEDGRLLDVQSFEVPVDDLPLLATATETYLAAGYAGFGRTPDARELRVRAEDYERFLRLQRRWDAERPTDAGEYLEELAAIRSTSPFFVDAYLYSARLLGRRFFDTREPADLEAAFELIDHAQSLAPADPAPWVTLFQVALGSARLDRAEVAARELERIVPGDARALQRRAILAEARGDGRQALALFREAVDRHPSAELSLDLANLEQRQGDVAAARATLEGLLARVPRYVGAERALARLELEAGDPAHAAQLYATLVERRPGFAELSNLGLARLLVGDADGAAESLRRAFALAPKSAVAALNLADAEQLAGRREEARVLYEQVVALVAADPATAFWQTQSVGAQALAHLGRAKEAAAAIHAATAAAPDNPQLAYEAALVLAVIGDLGSALASADRAIAGGFDRRWFAFPWFDPLRGEPAFVELLAAAPGPPTDRRPPAGR